MASKPGKTSRPAPLDDVLDAAWTTGSVLEIRDQVPADAATSSVDRYETAVRENYPRWVRLPLDPAPTDATRRYVAALRRRRGLEVVKRVAGPGTWAVWARATSGDLPS